MITKLKNFCWVKQIMIFAGVFCIAVFPSCSASTPEMDSLDPEDVVKAYCQAAIGGDFEKAVTYISDYSLAIAKITRDDLIAQMREAYFSGSVATDYLVTGSEVFDGYYLVHVMFKFMGSEGPYTDDWIAPLHLEADQWKINIGNIIDDRLIDVEPQTVSGVTVQPVQILRYTDTIRVVFSVRNDNPVPVFWGWVGVKGTLNFPGLHYEETDDHISFEADRGYPDAYVQFSGEFPEYPLSMDMTQWALATANTPNMPGFGTPWSYHFDFSFASQEQK